MVYKTLVRTALAAAVALPFFGGAAFAFDDKQREEIGTIVREYLLANPEILVELQEELEARAVAQEAEARLEVIQSSTEAIFNSPADPVLGNPDGDVTIVEFFDYNCGFCRRAMADMEQILATDDNVRFVLKEFPILGPESTAAHQVAMAVNAIAPNQYAQFHNKLMNFEGRADEESAIAIAVELGVDEQKLRVSMVDPSHSNTIQSTYELAQGLGITGTPSYVVGDALIPGALGVDELRARIAQVREAQ